jgi:DNA-binding CsgD family transcriptional regulator
LARASGWRSGEAFAQFNLAYCYGSLGQYADALACAQACVDIAQEIEHGEWTTAGLCALGALHRELLRFVSAQDYLQHGLDRARAIGAPHWIGHAAGMLASVFVDVGELESAERVLDSALTDKDPIIGYGQSRFLWCVRAELAVAEGRPEDALDILLKLNPSEPEELDQPPRFRIARTGAAALAAIGRTDDAVLLLRQVEHWAIRWSALSWVWRTQVALGRLRLAQRQRLAANELFASARQVIQQVAANVPEANDLRSTFLYQAQAQLPRTRPPSVKQVSKAAFGGLTEREREVAALVAQARSNSEIALTLVIGERTVETHVANILAKLGLRSRRDIAPWAAAHGL